MGVLTSKPPRLHLLDKNKKVIAVLLRGVHRAQHSLSSPAKSFFIDEILTLNRKDF